MVLLISRKDYADEFDCEFFNIVTDDFWEQFKEVIKRNKYPITVGFGTNEELEYDSAEDVLRNIEVKKITDEESEVIKRLLKKDFGVGSNAIDKLFNWTKFY